MGRERVIHLPTAEDTQRLAYDLTRKLNRTNLFALQGDLGAGKTTFVQGLAKSLAITDLVQSPTFTYLQIYEGSTPLYHFDLYRLSQERDFVLLGFEEYFDKDGIVVIEWPERIASLIPNDAQLISLAHTNNGRNAIIKNWGDR